MILLNILSMVISLFIGFIFLQSSYSKVKSIYSFKNVIYGYGFTNNFFTVLFALIIPALELYISLNLIIFNNVYLASAMGCCLQITFIFIMLFKLGEKMPYGCGCFGIYAPSQIDLKHIMMNFYFLLGFLFILVNEISNV